MEGYLMFGNHVVGWIIVGILVVYALYSIYHSITIYITHTKALKEFKSNHTVIEVFDESRRWIILSIIMILVCVYISFNLNTVRIAEDQYLMYRCAYITIALIFVTILINSLAGKRMWFTDTGFFFGDRFFKYTDIAKREPIGGVGSISLRIVMKNNFAISVTKSQNDKIESMIRTVNYKKKHNK